MRNCSPPQGREIDSRLCPFALRSQRHYWVYVLTIASLLIRSFSSTAATAQAAPSEKRPQSRSLLVIAHSDSVVRDLNALLDLRRGQGWGVTMRVIKPATPQAVIDLVESEREQRPGLTHLLLVGSHQSLPMASRPNYLIQQIEEDVPILTDDLYGLPEQNGLPQLAVGRLPVDAGPRLRQLATKIVQYEKGLEEIKPAVFVLAGRQPVGPAAQAAADRMTSGFIEKARGALANLELHARTTFPGPNSFSFEQAPETLRAGLAGRPLIAAYAGHGNRDGFATFHTTENFRSITGDDVRGFQIAEPCGLFVSCGCSMLDPEGESPPIGQEILLLSGGPVAVLGFTRINDDFYAAQLLETFVNELNPPRTVTLGELILAVKRRMAEEPQSPRSQMMQNMMALAGQIRPGVTQIDYGKAVRKNNVMLTFLGDPTTTMVIP